LEGHLDGHFTSLKEIRDRALLLNLGHEYLCDEPFLKKTGLLIDSNVGKLREDISSLKRRFPGKFEDDSKADDLLDYINGIARDLQRPDRKINEKCMGGALGRDLEQRIKALRETIDEIRVQVAGHTPVYTTAEAVLGLFGRLKPAVRAVATSSSLTIKFVVLLVLASLLPFSYLLFTMETEKDLLQEISRIETSLKSEQEALAQLVAEKAVIKRQIETIRNEDMSRQAKIEVMDLNVRVHKLDGKLQQVQIKVDVHETEMDARQRRLEETRSKSFLKRLLKQ
jgi:flagellar biosynthesis chaperone FliJ